MLYEPTQIILQFQQPDAGFSFQRLGCNHRLVHAKFLMYKMAIKQDFLRNS